VTTSFFKDPSYYGNARTEILRFLEPPLGRVLDVGCGDGCNAATLRALGGTDLTGIEIYEPAALRAGEVFDRVLIGGVEQCLSEVTGAFDTILAYDVLEHLVDPYSVVAGLRSRATDEARLHVSLPNARHWSLARDLIVRGSFAYTEQGHRDTTHLRWFTKSDAQQMLEQGGWRVDRVDHQELHPLSTMAARLSRGVSAEFLVYQWAILARAC
jgi:2-polyprenyl-3-methyl-5-hydroxy-6-metoxy-1,4-benzoquinol methylase